MDILNTDMLLKNQQKWKARGNQELDESEAGFHFCRDNEQSRYRQG